MELKKGKVYKIKHVKTSNWEWDRDYILCSPINDVQITDSKIIHVSFCAYFVVGFSSSIEIKTDENFTSTTFFSDCTLGDITPSDYQDIRKVIDNYNSLHNDKMLYNRKKNCLAFK